VLRYTDKRLSSMLNKRVEIWHKTKATERDRLGQYNDIDALFDTAYAGIIPQTGSLLSGRTADTALARTTHKIVMRYRADLKPDMWIVYNNTRYDILYILNPYENNERLEIFCEVLL